MKDVVTMKISDLNTGLNKMLIDGYEKGFSDGYRRAIEDAIRMLTDQHNTFEALLKEDKR